MEIVTEFFLTQGIQVCLFLIMVCLGLSLSLEDLIQAMANPKALFFGLVGQLALLPILAFVIVILFEPDPVVGIGLVLLAACPGGVTSNAYVLVSRGDVALSVALTAISSLLTVLTMPLLTTAAFQFLGDQDVQFEVPVNTLMISLIKLTVIPIAVGLILRARFPKYAEKIKEPARKVAFVLLITVVIGSTLSSFDVLLANILEIGFLALTLNVAALLMGYGIARFIKLSHAGTVSLTFEIGVQNLSLVLTLAMAILQLPEYAVFALVYALSMKVTALTLVGIWQKKVS